MGDRVRPAEAARELGRRDPVIKALVKRHGPPTLGRRAPVAARFGALAESIVYQQLNGRAASTIHGRLVQCLGGAVTAEALLRAPVADLRACGLSAAKTAALIDLAEHSTSGMLELERAGRMSDDEVVEHLIQVRGIGVWTAEMFLMFTLGRMDVWPVGDYGVRTGFARAWQLPAVPPAKDLVPHGEAFRPYRSVAAWYCWRALESG